jgi:hypothetical protein
VSALRLGAHAGAPLQTVSFSYFYERNLVSLPLSVGRTSPRFSDNLDTGSFGMKLPRHEFPGAAGDFPNGFQNRQLPPMRDIAIAKSFFRYGTCRKNLNPPYPPFSKVGNLAEFL